MKVVLHYEVGPEFASRLAELGEAGLELLVEASAATGLPFVTGVLDPRDVELVATHGQIVDEILRLAEESHADLNVLGTHGRGGLGHLILGSVAERVVRLARCPVLTVH